MNCPRCGSHMLHSHHKEEERINETILVVTKAETNECGMCGATIRVTLPTIYDSGVPFKIGGDPSLGC